MAALLLMIRNENVKSELKSYRSIGNVLTYYNKLYDTLINAAAFQMVEAICCAKVEQLEQHIDKSKSYPQMVPLKCTHESGGDPKMRCPCCGVDRSLDIL